MLVRAPLSHCLPLRQKEGKTVFRVWLAGEEEEEEEVINGVGETMVPGDKKKGRELEGNYSPLFPLLLE